MRPTTNVVATSDCTLPQVDDSYIGFTVGKPDGWTLNGVGGSVIVRKDSEGSELAMLYPVVPGSDDSDDRLFQTMADRLSQTAQADGGELSLTKTGGGPDVVDAEVLGNFAGEDVTGRAFIAPLGEQKVFAAYWAPTDVFSSEQETLAEIVGCYDKQVGTPLEPYQGTYFSVSVPEDWQVDNETTNGIDISAPNREVGYSFAYATGIPGVGDPISFRDQILDAVAVTDVDVVGTQDLGQIRDPTGVPWTSQATEFDAMLQGQSVHGIITSTVGDAGYGQFIGMASIRIAAADQWDSYANVLALIEEGARITKVSLASTPRVRATVPSNDFSPSSMDTPGSDENFEGWSEAMLGTETVQSPSTGDLYDVPLNSWDESEGGYVRELPGGGTELLEDY